MDDGFYRARYKGKPVMGYEPGSTYEITIEKNEYVYNVEAIGSPETKLIQYASEISIRQNWEFEEENT